MINIRHIGIYVNNIEKQTEFYKIVFKMISVCSNQRDSNKLLDELFEYENSEIITTKLITEQGKINSTGDMIELVKIIKGPDTGRSETKVFNYGAAHIAIGVDSLELTANQIINYGGSMKTKIMTHSNGNKFAFAIDPEGNWLELIERH